MRLVEQDGKKVLANLGITVPPSCLLPLNTTVFPSDTGSGPWLLKAQVLQGQRGKRGLIQRVDQMKDLANEFKHLRGRIGTEPCAGILLEDLLPIKEEWFVVCDLDRATGKRRLFASAHGGDTIETIQPVTSTTSLPLAVRKVCDTLSRSLTILDALTIEINPLGVLEDGHTIALDAKVELDPAAAFRHPEWRCFTELSRYDRARTVREHAYLDLLKHDSQGTSGRYIELDGDIAMILAGGGASLLAMDALRSVGGDPANYVELSGNPDIKTVKDTAEIILSHPGLRGIWIAGSFANFSDIHGTVQAVLEVIEKRGHTIPIVIRRDGPNADEAEHAAHTWAKRLGIPLRFHRGTIDFEQSAQELMALITSYELATI